MVEHSGLTALPSEFVFSYDRRYIERSQEGIARKVHATHRAAQHNCTVNNLAKQEYTIIELWDHCQLQRVGGHINVQGTGHSHSGLTSCPTRGGDSYPTRLGPTGPSAQNQQENEKTEGISVSLSPPPLA